MDKTELRKDHFMDRTLIKRYPFGRWELTRELIDKSARSLCDWCGSREGKFAYYVEYDSISRKEDRIKGVFCGKACMSDYHGFYE